MKFRNLGQSGLRISEIGLGCNNFGWRIGLEESCAVIDKAIELGITFFDTANTYGGGGGSEKLLGEILGNRRKSIMLATKFGMPLEGRKGASRGYIMECFEDSLRRLKTDWIDLYQLHDVDPLTPIDETLRALDDLVRQGKVRYIGCSNLPPWQIAQADHVAREIGTERFISTQAEYSAIIREAERELIPALTAYGVGLLPYFPLASGLLTGKYTRGAELPADSRFGSIERMAKRYLNNANWQRTEKLAAFCEQRGRTLVELAFSWLLARPTVASVMAGATKPEQVEANVKAAEWALTSAEVAEIDEITK